MLRIYSIRDVFGSENVCFFINFINRIGCREGGAVCDETQNLNDTDSKTFFRYQIFSRPIPRLFRYQNFSRPIPRLFSVPKFFETGSATFFGTKIFRDWFRDSISVPNFFDSGSETFFGTNFF